MKITSEPQFTVPVSTYERKLAGRLRSRFEDLIKDLEAFDRFLLVFFDNMDDLEDQTDLGTLAPLIKKYERQLKNIFKEFMEKLEIALESYQTGFVDTKLDNIRDLIIETTKSMRKGLIGLIKVFKNVDDKDFVKEVRDQYNIISSSIEQMNTIVKEELFRHIDYNILGRIRLGLQEAPLTLRG